MVWCMRPGKSDDQHVLESLANGVVAEISRWKLKMHAWRPVVPLWQGGGVCPVPEDDGASRHVAIDAFAQTIGSAPSLRGRVDPVRFLLKVFVRSVSVRGVCWRCLLEVFVEGFCWRCW